MDYAVLSGWVCSVFASYQKAASRTAMADTDIPEYLSIAPYSNEKESASWQEIPEEFFKNITSFLPENTPATTNPSIVTNFELIPVTENYSFTFFPVYSGTSYRDDVGFYIYDKSENDASLEVIKEGKIFDNQDVTEGKAVFQNYYTFVNKDEEGNTTQEGDGWADKPLGWLYNGRWRGRKITIIGKESKTPGKMQRIGFYIKPLKELKYDADGVFQGEIELQYFGTRYTNASLNDNTPYCTITPDANYYLLGLEDGWDKDGNDIVIAIPKTEVEYVDPESTVEGQFFTLAYEDMGAIGDFDFNDVVLRFKRVSGVNTVPVYLMAAGGTLPTWVYFKYTDTSGNTVYDLLGTEGKEAFTEQQVLTEDIESAEIHKLFGAPSHKTMVNTGSGITKDPVLLAKSLDLGDDYWVSREVNSFVIKVKTDDGSSIMVSTPNRNNGDKAPQGLCLPNEWQWPKERSSIVKAYPSIKNSNSETNTDDNAENYGDVNWYLNDKANKDEIWIGT